MLPDHFAALRQPRRPWLEAEALKEEFHRLSAVVHPDVPGTGDAAGFAAINAAYAALSEPASRLRHLLALEAPEELARPRAIPTTLADFFMALAALRQKLDAFFSQQSAGASAIARALLAGEKQTLQQQCETAHAQLETAHQALLADLRELDAVWSLGEPAAVERLATASQQFSYLTKWRAQLREALFQLTTPP